MSTSLFQPAQSAEPARFVQERTRGFAIDVTSFVPQGFEAYARVFHPATVYDGDTQTRLRWSEVARRTGQAPHKQMQWRQISATQSNSYQRVDFVEDTAQIRPPEEGSMPLELAQELWQLLIRHTSTPQNCFFAIWEGFGCLAPSARKAPSSELPNRKFHLFQAPIQTIEETFCSIEAINTPSFTVLVDFGEVKKTKAPDEQEMRAALSKVANHLRYQSANLWWPEDEAWCVATEIDFDSTLVAGSKDAVDALCANDLLEVYQLESTDTLWETNDR